MKKATRQRRGISAEVSALITTTLSEVLEGYTSGAMRWCQKFRPDLVNGLATIETYVNDLSQASDLEGVKEALSRYRAQVETMVKVFKARSGKTEDLF